MKQNSLKLHFFKRRGLRWVLSAALVGAVAFFATRLASAFTLYGPFDTWQVERIGYNLPFNVDIGGPMNLGEEYRWNIRTITFGFDESFKNYFGARGVEEVRKAVAILNSLPPFSKMSYDLSEFPLNTKRINHRAAALFIADLKSEALATLMEQMGLTSPERYAWCVRRRDEFPNNVVRYAVIRRNFDPVTWAPSSYVNGVLYTYNVYEFTGTVTFCDAIEFPVDPLAETYTSVASAGNGWFGGVLLPGEFFSGLTRDDVGGLRYLYRPGNYNIEALVSNTTASGSSPFTVAGGVGSNVVNVALRPGVDKITFVEAKYDSTLGAFITLTNNSTDSYVTNSTLMTQRTSRILVQPDIVFTAADLDFAILARTGPVGWANYDALNGQIVLAGPGVITPQAAITFNKVGPWNVNFNNSVQFTESGAFPSFVWGSFDGSTNAPVLYPQGTSLEDLERLVLNP